MFNSNVHTVSCSDSFFDIGIMKDSGSTTQHQSELGSSQHFLKVSFQCLPLCWPEASNAQLALVCSALITFCVTLFVRPTNHVLVVFEKLLGLPKLSRCVRHLLFMKGPGTAIQVLMNGSQMGTVL